MEDNNKLLLGIGGVAVLGVGLWLIFRKRDTVTNNTTNGTVNQQLDGSSSTVDSLGTTLGNLFQDIWSTIGNKNDAVKQGCQYAGPIDPYTGDGVDKDDYKSSEIKSMQTTLSSAHIDIKAVIDKTGGVDGIIGPGFKDAYNMARKTCWITGIDDLETQSNV